MDNFHLYKLLKMNLKVFLISAFFVSSLFAQDFIPQYKKHDAVFRNYIKKNKISFEKVNYYTTSKDYIPSGKPFLSELFHYDKDGRLETAKITPDSISTVIDSFFYDKTGSFSEIKRFTKIALPGRDSLNFESWFISRDTTGKITQISWFKDRLHDAQPRLNYHYTYSKNGKLSKIICPVVFGETTIDTLVYEYDKSERLVKRSNKINRSEYKYDGAGNMIERKDIAGKDINTVKMSYNKNAQAVKITGTAKNMNMTSELLYNKNSVLILTKTKRDKGTKGSESYESELREYTY
ncbi:hypothetical protein MASR2M39_13020 [Ignavibacteriales bacterium]